MSDEKSNEELRDEYLARVTALFDKVKAWTLQHDNKTTFQEESILIKEEPLDDYTAKVLIISRPGYKTIKLIPCGRWIIGAEGRVDMKSDLGTETFVYVSDGGPTVEIDLLTENGKVLAEKTTKTLESDIAEGWVFLQNRQLGMLLSLNAYLFHRLLEVLGR